MIYLVFASKEYLVSQLIHTELGKTKIVQSYFLGNSENVQNLTIFSSENSLRVPLQLIFSF